MDCIDDIESGHVDAGHCRHVADDGADKLSATDCADADRGEPSRADAGAAGGSYGGYLRASPSPDLLAGMAAGNGGSAGSIEPLWHHRTVDAADADVFYEYRRSDE